MPAATATRSYEPVAWFYEKLAHCFSFGRIAASKASQVEALRPGDRVLYVGVGSGEDAVLAARRGARVTCLDLSESMLERSRRRIAASGTDLRVDFICCDVMDHEATERYDAVAANFFLNVFPEPIMEEVLSRIVSLVRPGGRVLIADFAPPSGNALQRAFQRAYYGSANLAFWLVGLAPLHPIYDYAAHLSRVGLELESQRDFRILSFAASTFRSLVTARLHEGVPSASAE